MISSQSIQTWLSIFLWKTLINRCCSCLLSKIWFTMNITKAEPFWRHFCSPKIAFELALKQLLDAAQGSNVLHRVFSNKKERRLKALHSFLAPVSALSLGVHNSTFLGTGSRRAARCHGELRVSRAWSWRATHYPGFCFRHWLDETFSAGMKEHHQLLTHFSAPGMLLGDKIPCLLSSNLLLTHL